jgi:hypothetical protein
MTTFKLSSIKQRMDNGIREGFMGGVRDTGRV